MSQQSEMAEAIYNRLTIGQVPLADLVQELRTDGDPTTELCQCTGLFAKWQPAFFI
jgi:hypothetical protein